MALNRSVKAPVDILLTQTMDRMPECNGKWVGAFLVFTDAFIVID